MTRLALAAALLLPLPALASDAEGERITEELMRLAGQSRWSGVERGYARLVANHAASLAPQVHLLAAEAARFRGELLLCVQRLERVPKDTPEREQAEHLLGRFRSQTRLVGLAGRDLQITAQPFAPDLVAAYELATTQLKERGAWVGLLPTGAYQLDGAPLAVDAGKGWLPAQ